jgi:hypothetical protein
MSMLGLVDYVCIIASDVDEGHRKCERPKVGFKIDTSGSTDDGWTDNPKIRPQLKHPFHLAVFHSKQPSTTMMMKTAFLLTALTASASAFAPPAAITTSSSTALAAGKKDVMPPRMWNKMVDKTQRSKSLPFLPRPANLDGSMVGDVGFDPFYLSSIEKNFAGFLQPPSWENVGPGIPTLYWMREAELKHSRVAMMAVAGWIATDLGARFPFPMFQNIPNAYSAHDVLVQQGTMAVMLLAVGFVEVASGAVLVQVAKGECDRAAGDFGLDPPGILKGKSKAFVDDMKLKELNNGRIAMLAFGGIATQTALGSVDFPYFN